MALGGSGWVTCVTRTNITLASPPPWDGRGRRHVASRGRREQGDAGRRDVAPHDSDAARSDLFVELADVLVDRVAKGKLLDEHVVALPEPVDAACDLDLARGVEGWLEQVHAGRRGEREPDRAELDREDKDTSAAVRPAVRAAALEGAYLLCARLHVDRPRDLKHLVPPPLQQLDHVLVHLDVVREDDGVHRRPGGAEGVEVGNERLQLGAALEPGPTQVALVHARELRL
mmetsp:Transcript_11840/g.39232  ORF Transcript_11840/g.39232 Transcript_11840/m.39232 type:complete len:230 (+) Transcript_11840:36-725(+)